MRDGRSAGSILCEADDFLKILPKGGCGNTVPLIPTLRLKLIKIDAKVVRHARSVTFQLAEAAVPRGLFRMILQRLHRPSRPPPTAVSR